MTLTEILWVAALAVWTLVGLCLLAGMVYSFPTLQRLRGLLDRLESLLEVLDRRVDPLLERVERITGDVGHMSSTLRDDVEALGDALRHGAGAAERIVDRTEDRVAAIDGLLEVAQEEAEQAFLSTASLVRGLRSLRDRFSGDG